MKKYIKSKYIILFGITLIIANAFTITVQFLKGDLIDAAIGSNLDYVVKIGIGLLLAILFQIFFTYLYFRLENKIICSSISNVKTKVFEKIIRLNVVKFFKNKQGSFLAKYTNEIDTLENRYYRSITMLMMFGCTTIIVTATLFWLNWGLAIITIFLLTMPLYVPKIVEKKLRSVQKDSIDKKNGFISFLSTIFGAFEVIKNYSIETIFRRKFQDQNSIVMNSYNKNLDTQTGVRMISMFMSYFSYFVVVAYSAYLVFLGDFSVGEFFIAIGLVEQLSHPIIGTAGCIQSIFSVKDLTIDLDEFINQREEHSVGTVISCFEKVIEIKGLSFSYNQDEKLLNDINISFFKNGKYLIRGDSGKGKTTLINILLKYYSSFDGEILIDSKSIKDVDSMYNVISVSRQDALIFDDSLRNNISLYKGYSDEEVLNVLKAVSLEKYMLKSSLDLKIGKHGLNLSGGEVKRVTLARALLNKKDILILDEPFANLDNETINKLMEEIFKLKDTTVIIISHIVSDEKIDKFDYSYNL